MSDSKDNNTVTQEQATKLLRMGELHTTPGLGKNHIPSRRQLLITLDENVVEQIKQDEENFKKSPPESPIHDISVRDVREYRSNLLRSALGIDVTTKTGMSVEAFNKAEFVLGTNDAEFRNNEVVVTLDMDKVEAVAGRTWENANKTKPARERRETVGAGRNEGI